MKASGIMKSGISGENKMAYVWQAGINGGIEKA